jgi:hypothetical protein
MTSRATVRVPRPSHLTIRRAYRSRDGRQYVWCTDPLMSPTTRNFARPRTSAAPPCRRRIRTIRTELHQAHRNWLADTPPATPWHAFGRRLPFSKLPLAYIFHTKPGLVVVAGFVDQRLATSRSVLSPRSRPSPLGTSLTRRRHPSGRRRVCQGGVLTWRILQFDAEGAASLSLHGPVGPRRLLFASRP